MAMVKRVWTRMSWPFPHRRPEDQLLAVNEALAKFATVDARKAEFVNLRYFVGRTFEEAC